MDVQVLLFLSEGKFQFVKQSPVMKKLVGERKVKIVAATYDLDDGKVTLMESK